MLFGGNMRQALYKQKEFVRGVQGKVWPPVLLWFLGVPGFVCVLLWLFIFRD